MKCLQYALEKFNLEVQPRYFCWKLSTSSSGTKWSSVPWRISTGWRSWPLRKEEDTPWYMMPTLVTGVFPQCASMRKTTLGTPTHAEERRLIFQSLLAITHPQSTGAEPSAWDAVTAYGAFGHPRRTQHFCTSCVFFDHCQMNTCKDLLYALWFFMFFDQAHQRRSCHRSVNCRSKTGLKSRSLVCSGF